MEIQPSPAPTEIAWAAGLFEGEGCFNAYVRESGKIQMQMALGMTDQDVVERFAKIVACGSITSGRQQKPTHKPLHEWRLYEAEKVRQVIALLLPYLGERRRTRAQEVLALGVDVRSHNAKKTHCPKGHLLEGDNIILEPIYRRGDRQYFGRRCRICRTEQTRERMRVRLGITSDRYRKE